MSSRNSRVFIHKLRVVLPQDLINNHNCLAEEWNPNRTFSDIIKHVHNVKYITTNENRPTNDQDIDDAIYTVVFNTRIFYDDCDDWKDKTSYHKTWTEFQAHFINAQKKQDIFINLPQNRVVFTAQMQAYKINLSKQTIL